MLEIGAAHGIATEEVSRLWGSSIEALEPGTNLCNLAKSSLAGHKNISFQNITFEDFKTDKRYDGIFSATAFHWPLKELKFQKCFNLLKENGLLFVFWNNYSLKDSNVNGKVQNIYKQFHPGEPLQKSITLIQREKIEERKREIEESKLFKLVCHYEISRSLSFSTEKYIGLLKSFSTNNFAQNEIQPFYKNMYNLLESLGGMIEVMIVVNLEIAVKKTIM